MKEIPLFKIYWDKEDIESVKAAIEVGMNWAIGPNIEKFENLISSYLGVKHAVTFNSGTSALHSILMAYNLKPGDEVIVPSFTFIATANAPRFVGAKPIFADIEKETFGLDPDDVKRKITPKTKAIIPIHYGGSVCKIRELREIASDHDVLLIEDNAESLGSSVHGKKAGTFGDSSILSFCSNKIISTGEGGCVITDSGDICERLKLIRSHGRADTANFFTSTEYMDYVTLGFNFRMSNITAALGISQIKKMDRIIKIRKRNAEHMTKLLSQIDEIIPPALPDGYDHVYQMYTIRVKSGRVSRDLLLKDLLEKGISSKVYFHPVHFSKYYKESGYEIRLPVTEKMADEVLTLPMYPDLKDDEIDYIGERIQEHFGK